MQNSKSPIAIFIPSLRGGGAERAMLLFAQELLRRGYSVDLVVTQKSGPLSEMIPVGVTLIDLNQTRTIKALPGLVRYLRSRRPRALYSTIVHANVIAVLAGVLARTKTPVIIRESNAPVSEPKATWSRWVTFKLVPWTYRWATGIIAVSEGVAAELTAIDPRLAKTMQAIATPVISKELFDLAEEPLKHPWFQPSEPPVILGVARLQPHKGFINLVRAFREVRAERQVRLVILGEGKEREAILREVASLGLCDDVELAGFVLNPFPYMKRAAVFVLASEYEGLPNVLIQALALCTPSVATDCPSGPREILQGGALGTLVPMRDVPALADGIRTALSSERRRDAANSVQERFGVESATLRYLGIAGL